MNTPKHVTEYCTDKGGKGKRDKCCAGGTKDSSMIG